VLAFATLVAAPPALTSFAVTLAIAVAFAALAGIARGADGTALIGGAALAVTLAMTFAALSCIARASDGTALIRAVARSSAIARRRAGAGRRTTGRISPRRTASRRLTAG
jgi:hypothetical protein